MAKKFMGFKPETMTNKILPALGYNGPSDQKSINAFLAASPAAAAKMGKYTMTARQMVEGKPIQAANGYFTAPDGSVHQKGGLRDRIERSKKGEMTLSQAIRGGASPGDDRAPGSAYAQNMAARQRVQASPVINYNQPNPVNVPGAGSSPTVPGVTTVNGQVVGGNYTGPTGTQMPCGSLLSKLIGEDPNAMVTRAGVVAADGGPAALVPQGTGQAGAAAQALAGVVGQTATAEEIAAMTPAQYQAYESQQALQTALQNYLAAQGQLSPDSIVDPAQMDPFTAAAQVYEPHS